jgi:MerR family transcriptional regulator, thiopeptide resistance regulator
MSTSLTPEERREVFGEQDPEQYAAEAEQRWGDTDAYRQSQRRTSSYTKEDWVRIKAEAQDVTARFTQLQRSGAAADGAEAVALAEEHRAHISRWYYDCPKEMHRGLADMYVSDERFRRNYPDGVAEFIYDAIHAA